MTTTEKRRLRVPRTSDVRKLLESLPGPRVSAYVAGPEEPGFVELHDMPYRVRLALEAARRQLAQVDGAEETDAAVRDFLRPLELDESDLPRELPRPEWSFVAFFGPGFTREFALPIRAPDRLRVGERFFLLPMLASLRLDASFRVLALGMNHVQLYEGDVEGLRAIESKLVPASLEAALGEEIEREPDFRFHSSARGGEAAVFTGHGGRPDERMIDFERFYRIVAKAVARVWSERRDPLLLAADRQHQGRFRKQAVLAGLLEKEIEGDPEPLDPRELHARAWPIVLEELARRDEVLSQEVQGAKLAHGQVAALEAAECGLVARLWIADDELSAALAPKSESDELEALVETVLRFGGETLVARRSVVPSKTGLAAELRGEVSIEVKS